MTANAGREVVPAGPLQALIRLDADQCAALHADNDIVRSGLSMLAERIDLNERIIRRVLTQASVTVSVADKYCLKTGRHLWEVYPDLYAEPEAPNEDAFYGSCRKCAHPWLEVMRTGKGHGEGKRRIHLRCYACGEVQRIHAHDYVNRGGNPITQEQRDRIAALYSEGLPPRLIGPAVGLSFYSVRHQVEKMRIGRGAGMGGIVDPDSRRKILRELELARARQRAHGIETGIRAQRLRESGLKWREVGAEIGLTAKAAQMSARRLRERTEPIGMCITPECEFFERFYRGALCVGCGCKGEPGDLRFERSVLREAA